jgi:D-sedoheptulose 7-phosphate isomerase
MTTFSQYLSLSAEVLIRTAGADADGRMAGAVALIAEVLKNGQAVLVCGNGGSAADALHIATELVGRFRMERPAMNVIPLVGNVAMLTAWGNDVDFDTIFSRQVEAHGRAGDVLIALSTSGASPNILSAADRARALGLKVVALTGRLPNALADRADLVLAVECSETPLVQQVHQCFYHYLCEQLEHHLRSGL